MAAYNILINMLGVCFVLALEYITQQTGLSFETTWNECETCVYEARICVRAEAPCRFEPLKIQFFIPSIEVHYIWTPKIDLIRALNPSWYANLYTSNAFTGAPVNSLMRYDDRNVCTWAFSDTFETAVLRSWAIEETALYECSIKLFDQETRPRTEYTAVIRIDQRPVRYDKALDDVQAWWSAQPVNCPQEVPAAAKHAMYSTWYSYHQHLKVEPLLRECRAAKEMGCQTIILDDGWQTADDRRGYAYCGDWQLCSEKIADMRAFSDAVHELGMNVMLWYSVPYLGVKSQNYKRFKDKLLAYMTPEWAVLDIRYPDVREFLIETYERALREWNIDGFKLDFVDDFVVIPAEKSGTCPGMDHDDMLHATDALFGELQRRLRRIKGDVLIEFRQTFNGPVIRRYGNMLRAVDAPIDSDENRVRIANLRLLAGNTAVHSDMIMWHPQDSVQSAAMQVANILFGVPQLSMRLEELPASHAAMLTFYMDIWNQWRDVLLDGTFEAFSPRARFTQLRGQLGERLAVSVHMADTVSIPDSCGLAMIAVACYAAYVWLETEKTYEIRRYDCTGVLKQTEMLPRGAKRIAVEPADILLLSACTE